VGKVQQRGETEARGKKGLREGNSKRTEHEEKSYIDGLNRERTLGRESR
jgi:hypothetical protein